MADNTHELSAEELAAIEEKYDEGAATRSVGQKTGLLLRGVALAFAIYHYLTAGFALPPDHWHMGWHLAGLFILIYAFFPLAKTKTSFDLKTGALHLGGIPHLDWLLMVLGVSAALYLGFAWHGVPWLGIEEQTFRMGNPNTYDMVFGCIIIVLVLDIARRTLGWVLPLIICVFMCYALFGPIFPGILQHPGVKFRTFVSSMYFPQEGIYGVTLWVVSTIVFHFVLFGVIAQRTGLGQLFIDNATILAGRYTGGPAKVSVVSSAFFGTISGSSVANTVSTGALTIPNMKSPWLSRPFRGRGRGRVVRWRADHSADHGGRCLYHGRVPRGLLHHHRDRSDLSGHPALCRRLCRGAPDGAQART